MTPPLWCRSLRLNAWMRSEKTGEYKQVLHASGHKQNFLRTFKAALSLSLHSTMARNCVSVRFTTCCTCTPAWSRPHGINRTSPCRPPSAWARVPPWSSGVYLQRRWLPTLKGDLPPKERRGLVLIDPPLRGWQKSIVMLWLRLLKAISAGQPVSTQFGTGGKPLWWYRRHDRRAKLRHQQILQIRTWRITRHQRAWHDSIRHDCYQPALG